MKVLLLVCGLNVFTACYGMPPGDWEPVPEPVDQQDTDGEKEKYTDDPATEDVAKGDFVTE